MWPNILTQEKSYKWQIYSYYGYVYSLKDFLIIIQPLLLSDNDPNISSREVLTHVTICQLQFSATKPHP